MAASGVTEEKVRQALSTVIEPELHKDLITLNFVRNIEISGKDLTFTIMLTTPACPLKGVLQSESERALHRDIPEIGDITIKFDSEVNRDNRIFEKLNVPIKSIIAVSSGKGGVGKSTVSTNIAISLARDGARAGLLDADIYGPNIPLLMGIEELPSPKKDKIVPANVFGVEVMSMGFLIPRAEALVWRGPMLHSAISQLFTEVLWSELDYLVVDLPPGTGDAQLSLAQLVPLTGGIIVTGPQKIAVSDALRGVNAYNRLKVPVLGVLENMAGDIFGSGGGEQVAKELDVDFLGSIPLDGELARLSEAGKPIVAENPDGEIAQAFSRVARVLAGKISMLTFAGSTAGA